MDEIRKLIDKLNYHTKLYDTGKPEISDKEWDDMYFELVRLEKFYQCYFEDSPTQRVNFQTIGQLNKIEHGHLMLSLDKTKDLNDIANFLGEKDSIAMLKLDGLTCSLTYENGYLVRAETRGNGVIGEDILHNVLQIKNVPNRINYKNKLVIDGEVICTYRDFENFGFNQEYKNPRNFAAGSIRLLNSEESAMRRLKFVAWDVIEGFEDNEFLSTRLTELWNLNFDIVPFYCNKDLDEVSNLLKEAAETFSYPIDGFVFKYDKVKEYLAAGRTDHHFKGVLAYKFYDETYETRLLDIEWTMGRTGVLTPVAIFEPIDIDGTEISRASLHNLSIIDDIFGVFGPYKYQTIEVFKANMIIPQIKSAVQSGLYQENEIKYPKTCPVCGGETIIEKENDSEMLYCNNPLCEGKVLNRIDHFCSKKGLDIKGLSKATLEKLIDWGWVYTYWDIFYLADYRDEWIKKPGFGVASVDKILSAIEVSRNTTLDKVIAAAGIPEIGSKVAKDLAKYYESWYDFRNETNFLQYDGIGEVMNDNLLNFNYDELNLDEVVSTQLKIIKKEQNNTINNLDNLVFCITGKVSKFKNRNELQADIENKGGKVVGSVSKNVNYLINNDSTSASAKNVKAKELGIKIITEEQYLSFDF